MKKLSKLAAILAAGMMLFGAMGCSSDDSGSDPNPKVTTNKDGTVTITVYTGQNGIASCNGNLNSEKGCYDNFPSKLQGGTETASIGYVVNTDTAGEYTLSISAAFGGNADYLRDAYVIVNGVQINTGATNDTLNFDWTIKNWTVYKTATTTVNLVEGDNSIVLKAAELCERTITRPAGSSWGNAYGAVHGTNSDTIGVVTSLPNINWMSLTSPVKTPVVKLTAGSKDSAYYSLNATSENTSWGTIATDCSSFKSGSPVTLTATPKSGYKFDCWHGTVGKTSVASNDATYQFTLAGDTTIAARFIPETYTNAGLEGYATVSDDAGTTYTITGGLGGDTITISSWQDLLDNKSKISGKDPYIVKFTKRVSSIEWVDTDDYNSALSKLTTAGKTEAEAKFILKNRSFTFDIGSNKTVIGEAGKDYGLININPKISGSNVIVKNLHFGDVIGDDYFGGSGNDAMSIKGGQHVWIDHCEFSSHLAPADVEGNTLTVTNSGADYVMIGDFKLTVDLEGESSNAQTKWAKDFYDGLLDVSETSRFVSISNSYFHDHWKACLCGGSNDKAETQPQGSQVRMTMYNNYFKNIHARQPLFRFGKAHIYSSYISGADSSSSAIEVRAESKVYVDNVYFENLNSSKTVGCWNDQSGLGQGDWKVVDCYGASGSYGTVAEPPYEWTKTSAANSKANLPTTAGIEKAD